MSSPSVSSPAPAVHPVRALALCDSSSSGSTSSSSSTSPSDPRRSGGSSPRADPLRASVVAERHAAELSRHDLLSRYDGAGSSSAGQPFRVPQLIDEDGSLVDGEEDEFEDDDVGGSSSDEEAALNRKPGRRPPRSKMGKINKTLLDYSKELQASLSSLKPVRRKAAEEKDQPVADLAVAVGSDPRSTSCRRTEKLPMGPTDGEALLETGGDAIEPRSKSLDAGHRHKRSRERQGDDGAAKRSKVTNHLFSFKYDEDGAPFLSNSHACARFVRSVKGGGSSSFKLDELSEIDAFEDFSKKLCSTIGAANRLANS